MSRERRIRLKPFDSSIRCTESGFQWKFTAESEHGNRYVIIFNFDSWWLRFCARDLWTVLREKRRKLEENENAMKGQP